MVFINGIGMISPQQTADPGNFLPALESCECDFLTCLNPDYKQFIPPIAARRMSRLIKMGISSAKIALADAGLVYREGEQTDAISLPDAIITGTGLGSVEDTEKILSGMVAGEELMNPTPFIQSTYNTISSQIAIALKCHHYNTTYVHRSFSFESALQDALMLFAEGSAKSTLVGGIDEMTENHLLITRRAGHWKVSPTRNLELLNNLTPGALPGEGSGFFFLQTSSSPTTYARISGVSTLYRPGSFSATKDHIRAFLRLHELQPEALDAVILGCNGDSRFDPLYDQVSDDLFSDTSRLYYKHLCGEYYTSTGFALYLAANILKHQTIPSVIRLNQIEVSPLRNILIYNQYHNIHHSLILVQSVR